MHSLNRRQIELDEGVVLRAKQTSPFSIALPRIDPTLHDPPAYECLHPLGPIPAMKQQSVHAVRSFIDLNFCQWHCGSFRSVSNIKHEHFGNAAPIAPAVFSSFLCVQKSCDLSSVVDAPIELTRSYCSGFHSRANLWASAICSGVICLAT